MEKSTLLDRAARIKLLARGQIQEFIRQRGRPWDKTAAEKDYSKGF